MGACWFVRESHTLNCEVLQQTTGKLALPFDALDAAPDAVPPGVPRAALVKNWMNVDVARGGR
jgi:hypothetical protein